jgi:restriction endonuclease S subunit
MGEWRSALPLYGNVEIINGGTPSTDNPRFWNGSIGWLSVDDFNTGFRYVYNAQKSITETGVRNSSTTILKKGQIIISARGTVGVVAQAGKELAFNQSCYGINSIGYWTNDFLYYNLLFMADRIRAQTHGNVFGTITKDTFKNIFVPVPSTKEQSKIAEVLATVDEAIDKTRAVIEKYTSIKAGMMQDLLGRGDEVMTFSSIADNITKKKKAMPFDVCINMDSLDSSTGRLIAIAESDLKSEKIAFSQGDVLFGKLRPYLRKYWYAQFDGLCSSEIMVFRAKPLVRSEYLYYIATSEHFVEYNNAFTFGTRMPRTSWGIVSKYDVVIPSLSEQDFIIEKVVAADAKIQTERDYLAKLQDIKRGLMHDLLTNTVSVDALGYF